MLFLKTIFQAVFGKSSERKAIIGELPVNTVKISNYEIKPAHLYYSAVQYYLYTVLLIVLLFLVLCTGLLPIWIHRFDPLPLCIVPVFINNNNNNKKGSMLHLTDQFSSHLL